MRKSTISFIGLSGLFAAGCALDGQSPDPEDPAPESEDTSALIAPAANWTTGLPFDAIVGGRDNNGAPLYICRGNYNGGIHPGKTRRDWATGCDIGYGGGEVWVTDAQAMVPAWAPGSAGSIPVGAKAYGSEATGEALFVCRASYAGGLQVGKVRSGFTGCAIPYGGAEISVPSYQVLINPDRLPLHGTVAFATLPADAIIAGRDTDGSLLYPCIASYAGGWQLGKTRAGWAACDIGYGGGEHSVTLYQVLAPEWNAPPLNPATQPFAAGSESGYALGACSAPYGSGVQVGKLIGGPRCNFGYGGAEVSLGSGFNVLSTWATTLPIDYDTGGITFDNGVPVGGSGHLTVNYDGSFTFSGHFHDSGAWCFNDRLALVLKSKSGHAFEFSHSGSMGGTFCGGSRDDNFTVSGVNGDLATAWTDLQAGWTAKWNASSSLDFASLFQAAKDAVGYIQTAVAIVGAFV